MVTFTCSGCGESGVAKKKVEPHAWQCGCQQFNCDSCGAHFDTASYKAHTTCISEAEKYEKGLYRGKKSPTAGSAASPTAAPAAKKEAKTPAAAAPVVPAPAVKKVAAAAAAAGDDDFVLPAPRPDGVPAAEEQKQKKKRKVPEVAEEAAPAAQETPSVEEAIRSTLTAAGKGLSLSKLEKRVREAAGQLTEEEFSAALRSLKSSLVVQLKGE